MTDRMTTQQCKCPECNCDYKLEGYAESEDVCGACLDNCMSEKCAECGESVPEWDTVWIDPATRKATMTGRPFHPGCAPEQYPEKEA